MAKVIKCPERGCCGTGVPVDTKKKFSFTKAAGGALMGQALFGPMGAAIAGAASGAKGKNGKTTFVCNVCGRVFKKKV